MASHFAVPRVPPDRPWELPKSLTSENIKNTLEYHRFQDATKMVFWTLPASLFAVRGCKGTPLSAQGKHQGAQSLSLGRQISLTFHNLLLPSCREGTKASQRSRQGANKEPQRCQDEATGRQNGTPWYQNVPRGSTRSQNGAPGYQYEAAECQNNPKWNAGCQKGATNCVRSQE